MNSITDAFDQQLAIALTDYLQRQLESLPDEQELAGQLIFSRRFEKRIGRLIRKAARAEARSQRGMMPGGNLAAGHTRVRRRLAIAAIIIAILASVFSISAAREAVINFIVTVYEKYSTIIFPTAATSSGETPETSSQAAWPAYKPAGYSANLLTDTPDYSLMVYKGESGQEILLERVLSANVQVAIDTEGVTVEYISRGDRQHLCYLKNGVQTVIWQNGKYAFLLSGPVSRDILLEMADSIP
jgi:hypothetical protein